MINALFNFFKQHNVYIISQTLICLTQKKQEELKVYYHKFVVSLSVHLCFMTDLT